MGDQINNFIAIYYLFIMWWQTLATGVTDDSRSDTDSADNEEEEEEDKDLSMKTKKSE